MFALKGLLRNQKPSASDLTRTLQTAISGIARFTIDGRSSDLAAFRDSMQALASSIHEQASSSELESITNDALELLRDYNDRSSKFHSVHAEELKSVMRTMTETITFLSESRTRSVHQLQFMEREMEQATQIDDVRLLRARLVACLDVVREETARLQTESENRSTEVRQQVDRAIKIADQPSRFGSMDAITGLPARKAAESAIRDAVETAANDKGTHALSVFVVTRLQSINSKYGRAVGDEVMLRVANHFAQHLSSSTLLYRWSGPALVSISAVKNNAEELKRSWTKAAAVKQEISFDNKGRSIFALIETSMFFDLVNKGSIADDVMQRLDRFVAGQTDGTGEELGV